MNVRLPALLPLLLFLTFASCVRAQDVPDRLSTGYAPLDQKLERLVTADSLAVSAHEANAMKNALFLDARELNEYAISHLPGARLLGYDELDLGVVNDVDKDRPVVVYCTVGYRSERAAEKLRDAGFKQVYNLYGSLYAWKLAGLPLVDARGNTTEQLHTYNKKWGRFVPDSIGVKVWD